jgi:hypothetical protein
MEDVHRLHANITPLYNGLEHPQILVSSGDPTTNPVDKEE